MKYRQTIPYRLFSAFLSVILAVTFAVPVWAQGVFNLPAPGTMVSVSPAYTPPIMIGMRLDPSNPMVFDFIVDRGDENVQGNAFEAESKKIINYFMAALAVPEDEAWVNLSPYEENRIMADGLSKTEMGRDMLLQDYLLKQLSSSMLHPDSDLGEGFWKAVYQKAQTDYGTTDIPADTFNKIWIVPEESSVFVNDNGVFIVKSKLNVMLEEDYLAMQENAKNTKHGLGDVKKEELSSFNGVTAEVIRNILLPAIKEEVNNGKQFAPLRQIFHAVILAGWYKKHLKQSILGKLYFDQNRIDGIDLEDKQIREKVYKQYVEAFKTGVYDLIKEDYDPETHQVVPKRYFGGGIADLAMMVSEKTTRDDIQYFAEKQSQRPNAIVSMGIPLKTSDSDSADYAMLSNKIEEKVHAGVTKLNNPEAVWIISQLMNGVRLDDLTISARARNELISSFSLPLEKIETMMIENNGYRLFAPSTWGPDSRREKLKEDLISPKYNQLFAAETGHLLTFIKNNHDLETAAVLDQLFDFTRDEQVLTTLRSDSGRRLLSQMREILQSQDTDDLVLIFSSLLSRIRENWGSQRNEIRRSLASNAEEMRLALWNEKRVADGAYVGQLAAAKELSDWDKYTQVLVQAIEEGSLRNVEYINYYLEQSALLERPQERNYQKVVKTSSANGMHGIILNDRTALYKKAREAVVNNLGKSYLTDAATARVILGLNEHNSPDLGDAQRNELFKQAREAAVRNLGKSYKTEAAAAGVILSLNVKNSPDLSDAERNELYKRARNAVFNNLGKSYETQAAAAGILLRLNKKNSPDLTDDERQEIFRKARQAALNNLGKSYETQAATAGVLLRLNKNNSPDLTDDERQEIFRKARDAAFNNLGQSYKTQAAAAGVLLSLTKKNSPDLTDDERQEIFKKARQAALNNLGKSYETQAATAGVLLRLNKNNSPDLTDDERQEIFRKARDAAFNNLGKSYGTQAAAAGVLLSPSNIIIDMIEGDVMTWGDLRESAADIYENRYSDNDIFPGIPNELLFIGLMVYMSGFGSDIRNSDMQTGEMNTEGDASADPAGADGSYDESGGNDSDAAETSDEIDTDMGDIDADMSDMGMDTDFGGDFDSGGGFDSGDSAMLSAEEAEIKNGGIDFNTQAMAVEEIGSGFHYNIVPDVLDNFQSGPIQILPPVILEIAPVADFQMLLVRK
ncbi:MAG: hypothetical protein AB1650_03570 [Candidatus Omnitrophota bacterium]